MPVMRVDCEVIERMNFGTVRFGHNENGGKGICEEYEGRGVREDHL